LVHKHGAPGLIDEQKVILKKDRQKCSGREQDI